MLERISYKEGVVSRKAHLCSGCLDKWEKGTRFDVSVVVDGADIWTWRECPVCQEIKKLPSFDYEDLSEGEYANFDEFREIRTRVFKKLGLVEEEE